MGKKLYWILIVVTAIMAGGVAYFGLAEKGRAPELYFYQVLAIMLSFVAIILAGIADRQNK